MARDQFIDLLPGGLGTYSWPINHSEEDESGMSASIQRTAPVDGMGFVYQISETSPLVLRWKGTVLQHSQILKMWQFYGICQGAYGNRRTIHILDFAGGHYEVLFNSFQPVRNRVAYNPRAEREIDKLIKWTYSMEMDVIRVITGWP